MNHFIHKVLHLDVTGFGDGIISSFSLRRTVCRARIGIQPGNKFFVNTAVGQLVEWGILFALGLFANCGIVQRSLLSLAVSGKRSCCGSRIPISPT